MNFNICIAALLSFAAVTSMASDKGMKTPPPIERIKARDTKQLPPVPVEAPEVERTAPPVQQHYGSSNHPRGQYINMGTSQVVVAPEVAKREMEFCTFLSIKEGSLLKSVNENLNTSFDKPDSKFKYHLMGINHNRSDGMVQAFVYESVTGTFYTFKNSGQGQNHFEVFNVPRDIVIKDLQDFKGDNFYKITQDGRAPLCGRYAKIL